MHTNALVAWLQGLSGPHALRFDQASDRRRFFSLLVRSPVARHWWPVLADGGLLGDYSLLDNIFLPAQGLGETMALARFIRWHERLDEAGIAPLPVTAALVTLTPWQRRLAAFLRAVVADAPALVFDDTCYGLSREEQAQAARMHGFYQRYFPFRPSLYVTLSALPPELEIPSENIHHHAHAFA